MTSDELQPDVVIEACRAGVAADPHDIALRERWFDALRAAGRLEEAGPALDVPIDVSGGPLEAGAVALLIRADRLLARAGLLAMALDALERALAIRPDSGPLEALLLTRADAAGHPERAAALRTRARERMAGGLPARLAEGFAALRESDTHAPLPAQALAWAWELADKTAWSAETWRAELDWATKSRQLLRQWWSVSSDRGTEISALVDPPDLAELRAAQAEGRAQVMAGAHCGPTWAAVQIFQACGLGFRTMGAAGLDQLQGGRTVIPLRDSRAATARELIGEVRKGVLIGMLADRASPGDRIEADFLGRRVELSSLPARLALRYGCPSWWCQPLWRGERIVIELERLPDPEPQEAEADWIGRWSQAFLARLEPVMRGDPRNLDLTKGVWRAAR